MADTSGPSRPIYGRPPPSYIQMTPKRAIKSFENLVALANYEERLTEARKMVWRDRGEPVAEVEDLWECLEHAGRGGLRAGALAFNIRVGVNLFLLLFRLRRVKRKLWLQLVRRAIFGPETLRFTAMFGSFACLYKLILNALPIIVPPPNSLRLRIPDSAIDEEDDLEAATPLSGASTPVTPGLMMTTRRPNLADRRPRLSLSASAQQLLVRKQTRRWHAVAAGSIAGAIAVMFETRGNRIAVAQQMFVRGLQGSYNAFTSKRGIKVPNGDVLVFALCCGQILYGFLLRPDTLPNSYNKWIETASMTPPGAIRMNRDLVRDGRFKIPDLESVLRRDDVTPHNRSVLLDMLKNATSPNPSYPAHFGPCEAVHPMIDSCLMLPVPRFFDVFKWMFPIYGALHFIPMILFKRNAFMKDPKYMLLRAGWGTTRSSAFLGAFVLIYQVYFCWKHWMYSLLSSRDPLPIPRWLVNVLISKPSFWLGGLFAGLSLFVEEKRRRGELAMYVLPKGLQSAWVMARGKGLVFRTGKFGEPLLTAIGMGMVMSIYQNDPQYLSGLVRRILYQFIGPN
ncbi:hypothetical protein OE88DRAFT_1637361 [Heliocybe sulcata]|uniref:Transmembrane protein 135 N-terminal domain-containing protein n=1 Tax=Heliocybe sulcata TaxID=5364 RepID=A0A5C3MNV4_9AGAM|nr:hypothetical protein OE88DRAFT_1637361 [Heliocybe sulcata]